MLLRLIRKYLQRSLMNSYPALLLFLLILFSSCGGTRIDGVKVKKMSARSLINNVEDGFPDYETFSSRARVKFTGSDRKTSFTAHIRLEKNKRIWLSISPALNIEVGRALITPDSIKVIDRINKEYTEAPFNSIQNYLDYPVDFQLLQELLLGTHIPDLSDEKSKINEKAHLLRKENQSVQNLLWIDPFQYHIKKMDIYDIKNRQKMSVQQEKYNKQADGFFSEERSIVLKSPESSEIHITFSRVSFNKDVEFPFSVPEKYL